MRDAVLKAEVTRATLGLPTLQINSGGYKVVSIFGGSRTWKRQTTHSPYVDGEFTVNRVLGVVEDKVVIDVTGKTQAEANVLLNVLVDAFDQSLFNLTLYIDERAYTYACEAADYTMDWSTPRIMGIKYQIAFAVRRSPVPVNGGI